MCDCHFLLAAHSRSTVYFILYLLSTDIMTSSSSPYVGDSLSVSQSAQADALAVIVNSHRSVVGKLVYARNVDTLAIADFLRANALVFLTTIAKFQNKKSFYFTGSEPTYIDFYIYDSLDVLTQVCS